MKCEYCKEQVDDGKVYKGIILHNSCYDLYKNRELGKSNGLNFICPECEGTGEVSEFIDVYPKGLPDSGQFDSMTWKKCTCRTCGGKGYTRNKKRAIIGIVGYK